MKIMKAGRCRYRLFVWLIMIVKSAMLAVPSPAFAEYFGSGLQKGGHTVYLGDGGINPIGGGTIYRSAFQVPCNCTLLKIGMMTPEVVGNITIDVWVDSFANWLPTDADSLFDVASEPVISDASTDNEIEVSSFDSDEDDWEAGDIVMINVDAVTTLKEVIIFLEWERAVTVSIYRGL